MTRAKARARGHVEPLHLSFKSDKVYYPLRFSSRQCVFDLNLYVFTKKELDFKKSAGALKKINHTPPARLKKNVAVTLASLPESLRKQPMTAATMEALSLGDRQTDSSGNENGNMKVSLSTRAELGTMFTELGKRLEANAGGSGLG